MDEMASQHPQATACVTNQGRECVMSWLDAQDTAQHPIAISVLQELQSSACFHVCLCHSTAEVLSAFVVLLNCFLAIEALHVHGPSAVCCQCQQLRPSSAAHRPPCARPAHLRSVSAQYLPAGTISAHHRRTCESRQGLASLSK